jgi:fucose 4-O-acetylase-like acetyltransferase
MIIKNSRIEYIDFLKGFLLMEICFSHFGYLPSLFNFLFIPTGSIYVPTFFLISGLLFNEDVAFLIFLNKKVKTLLIPYIFFFAVFVALDWNIYLKTSETLSSILKVLIGAGGPPKSSPIWFIIKLFEVNLLYFLITYTHSNMYIRFILILFCSILGYLFYLYSIKLVLGLDVILSSVLLFGVGHLGKKYFNDFSIYLNQKSWSYNSLVFIFLFFVSISFDRYNSYGVLAQNKINNYFLFYFASITGGIGLIILSNFLSFKFSTNKVYKLIFSFFKYLAENALTILGTHVFIIIIIIDLVLKRLDIFTQNEGFFLKFFSISILTFYLIVPFLNNKFYFIFGKNKPIKIV